MPPSHAWGDWHLWLLVLTITPWLLFITIYATRAPWYRWSVGRSIMLSKVVIVAVLANGIIGRIWPHLSWHGAVYVALIGGSFLAGTYQLLNLWREQRKARQGPPTPNRRSTDWQ